MSTTTTTLTGFETRCSNCAASLSFNPEDVIITCEYCGSITDQKGESVPNHFMLPNNISSDELLTTIIKWLPSGSRIKKNMISLVSVQPMLIPYWGIHVDATSNYSGYKTATEYREERRTRQVRTSDGGTKTETYTERIPVTVYIPIESSFNENRRRVILSRQGALFYGQEQIESVIDREIAQAKPFNLDMVKELGKEVKFLSGEIELSDARELVTSQVRADHRQQAKNATTELFDCRTKVQTGDAYFIHYPFWSVEYMYEGKSFRVAIDGFTKQILKGETPVTIFARFFNLILTLFLLTIGSLSLFYYDFTSMNNDQNEPIIIVAGIVAFIAYIWSLFAYSKVYKISGEKRDIKKNKR